MKNEWQEPTADISLFSMDTQNDSAIITPGWEIP